MNDWKEVLGRDVCATDQEPGTYRYRACRRCPWQPVRLLWDGYKWHCLLRGQPVSASGQQDPLHIPFIKWHAPFHPIGVQEYLELVHAYNNARPGSPLLTPEKPISMRDIPT
jgi:hypothetical protein